MADWRSLETLDNYMWISWPGGRLPHFAVPTIVAPSTLSRTVCLNSFRIDANAIRIVRRPAAVA